MGLLVGLVWLGGSAGWPLGGGGWLKHNPEHTYTHAHYFSVYMYLHVSTIYSPLCAHRNCRDNGTRHRLKQVLEGTLRDVLPEDVAEACSGGIHVAITRVTPALQPTLVSSFRCACCCAVSVCCGQGTVCA